MSGARDQQGGAAPWTRGERVLLLGLVLLALALRVHHVLALRSSPLFEAPIMDARYHLEWARAVAAGETYQTGPFFRAPLYPWFLSLGLRAFGEDLVALRLVQAVLGALTTVLTYGLARRTFGRLAAAIAGGWAATSWVLIHFDGELLIPALLVPLLLIALHACLSLGEEPSPGRALRCGLAFGAAAIARPNVLLFVPLLALWTAARAQGPGGARRAGALLLGLALPILPLTAYNRIVGEDWVLISSQAGVNLWIGNNPSSDGSTAVVPGTRGGWFEGFHDARAQAAELEGRELADSEISAHYVGRVLDWVRAEPWAALRHQLFKLRLFWLNWELGNNQEVRFFSRRFDPLARWSLPFALLAGLGLVGAGLALRSAPRRLFPLWGFLVVYTLSVVAFFVCSRFRVPVLPVLMVFAGGAVMRGLGAWRAGARVAVVAGALVAAALAAFSAWIPGYVRTGPANGLLQLAQGQLTAGDADLALESLEEALRADERHPLVRVSLATQLARRGETGRAQRLLQEALQDHPERPEAAQALVGLWIDSGEPEAAAELAREHLARNPVAPGLRYELGRALAALGQTSPALEAFARAEAEDPGAFGPPFASGPGARRPWGAGACADGAGARADQGRAR